MNKVIEYVTSYYTVADEGTLTITGRGGRATSIVSMLVNGTGVETVDATMVFNNANGDAIVAPALTQVTSAAGAPTLLTFNNVEGTAAKFPYFINENESLVLTCDSSAGGAMYFAVTLRIEKG